MSKLKLNPRADKNCKKCLGTGIQSRLNLLSQKRILNFMPVEVVDYRCDCLKKGGV